MYYIMFCTNSVGMDYNHGTGHGVGAYLAVHEGPVGVGRDNSVLQVKNASAWPIRISAGNTLHILILFTP